MVTYPNIPIMAPLLIGIYQAYALQPDVPEMMKVLIKAQHKHTYGGQLEILSGQMIQSAQTVSNLRLTYLNVIPKSSWLLYLSNLKHACMMIPICNKLEPKFPVYSGLSVTQINELKTYPCLVNVHGNQLDLTETMSDFLLM